MMWIEHVFAAIGVVTVIAAAVLFLTPTRPPQTLRQQWEDRHAAAERGDPV